MKTNFCSTLPKTAATMSSVTNYRTQPTQLSESDSSGSDEEDQPWKRQKKFGSSRKETPMVVSDASDSKAPPQSLSSSFKRKRNNVWGEVVQQQEEEQVARDMTQFDMYSSKERDVESYSYQNWDDGAIKQQPLGNPITYDNPVTSQKRKLPEALGGSNDDAWLVDGQEHPEEGVKDRLGSRKDMNDKHFKRGLTNYDNEMKFVELSSDMDRKDVAGKIAYSLQEPKREMVKTVVEELGIEKSIAVWKKTWDVEQNEGMMVNNGSRRRTPGGVFFQLLKTDPDIPKEKKEIMFAMSSFQSKQEGKLRRRRMRKKRRKNSMDVQQGEGGRNEMEAEIDRGERHAIGGKREQIEKEEDSEGDDKYDPSSEAERRMERVEADRDVDNRWEVKENPCIIVTSAGKAEPDDMEEGEISD